MDCSIDGGVVFAQIRILCLTDTEKIASITVNNPDGEDMVFKKEVD